jgi:hypothetical protein
MRPRFFYFLCLILLPIPAFAQDKPTIKVVVSRCEAIGSKTCEDGRLSHNQLQWWRESGQKKFPRIQLVEDRADADWILFWAADEVPYTVTTPTTATTTHHPGTNTSQTTINHGQQQEKAVIFVDANARKLTHTDGSITFSKMPDHAVRHKGQWLWSKPDKDAFEKLIRAIAKYFT